MTQFNYNQSGHIDQKNQLSQELFYGRHNNDQMSHLEEQDFNLNPFHRTYEIINEDE